LDVVIHFLGANPSWALLNVYKPPSKRRLHEVASLVSGGHIIDPDIVVIVSILIKVNLKLRKVPVNSLNGFEAVVVGIEPDLPREQEVGKVKVTQEARDLCFVLAI
jgi:hypothetical protein